MGGREANMNGVAEHFCIFVY